MKDGVTASMASQGRLSEDLREPPKLPLSSSTASAGTSSTIAVHILIKITQCHCLVRIFLQNGTTNFDETLHVAWVCPGEGFSTIGTSGYSPVCKKGGRRPP